MLHVLKMSLHAQMETAYKTHGNVTMKMTVMTNLMKNAVLVRNSKAIAVVISVLIFD